MNTNEPIVIERTANGWQVRPLTGQNQMVCIADIHVFQDMGFATAGRDGQETAETLLGFIAGHFPEWP